MREAFHLGGWGMYPTLVAGLILMFSAIQYARHPEAARLRVVRFLSVLVMLTSCLGFVSGVIKTCTSVSPALGPDLGMIVITGIGESLTNIGAGLVWLVMSTIVATFGAARTTGADLADPHSR
jgi:hypothetical protein